jgi:pSer/pThr/pTyr-binding forkhead associated (FHA) protein
MPAQSYRVTPGEKTVSQTGPAFVLKFISGKYQGGEFPLELDREILIGRGSDLDMVLVEDMVSRRHARITTFGGELVIEDMGSTNGTFVNGEKITRSRLKEGDRILVGTSIIKLVASDEDTDPGEVADLPEHAYRPQAAQAAATATGLISGKLDEVPLTDLLQLFSSSRKSGVLIIHSHREGRIYLREGRVFYGMLSDDPEVPPEKAFYRLLQWRRGTFVLEPPDDTFELPMDEIEMSTESLMMEGMRQLDEIANLGDDVPDFHDGLVIARPLVPPLRSLTPELLDSLQLAVNYSTVENVLNRSLASDLDTMQDLVYLIRNGYLSVRQ